MQHEFVPCRSHLHLRSIQDHSVRKISVAEQSTAHMVATITFELLVNPVWRPPVYYGNPSITAMFYVPSDAHQSQYRSTSYIIMVSSTHTHSDHMLMIGKSMSTCSCDSLRAMGNTISARIVVHTLLFSDLI